MERVRVGPGDFDSAAFVLADFPRRDREKLNEMIDPRLTRLRIDDLGIAEAMAKHN
jgi:hypothetical protein